MPEIIKRIFKLIGDDKFSWITIFILDLCINIIMVINPLIISYIINAVIQKQVIDSIVNTILIMIAISFMGSFIVYKKMILKAKANNSLNHEIFSYFINKFYDLSRKEYLQLDSAYFSDRLMSDNLIIVQFIVETLWKSIFIIITALTYFILIAKIDYRILFLFVFFILAYIIIYYVSREKLYNTNYEFLERKNKNKSLFYNLINLNEFIKLQVLQSHSLQLFDKDFEELKLSSVKLVKVISEKVTLIEILKSIFTGILLILGANSVLNGTMMVGTLFIIDSYFYTLLNNIDYLMNLIFEYQQVRASIDRMEQFLEMEVDIDGSHILNNINEIELRDISISYGNVKVLEKFNQVFTTGNIYILKGANGSGKSTIINIISGIEKSYSGNYIINRCLNSYDINLNYFRKYSLSVCEQEINFINDSILNNLLINVNKIDESNKIDKIYYYCKKFKIYEYILSLKDGFDTIISDKTELFSDGQRKKLGIIRSMIKSSNILIMDEPEASLDRESIDFLYGELRRNFYNSIVIIVSHSNNYYRLTNNIIDLGNKTLKIS